MGPPPRSFAADAYYCIMVGIVGSTEYKYVAPRACGRASLGSSDAKIFTRPGDHHVMVGRRCSDMPIRKRPGRVEHFSHLRD